MKAGRRIGLAQAAFLFLTCSQMQAAEFVVTVPDELISEGAGWEHFSQTSGDERNRLFIEKVMLAPQYKWIRDFLITGYTWGRIKDWDKAEITIKTVSGG